MRSAKALVITISPSNLSLYGSIILSALLNVLICMVGLSPIAMIILSVCLWGGLGINVWLSQRQDSIRSIEVGTERVLSVNGERAHDWYIGTGSRQIFGLIWLVVSAKSKNKTYKQLLMSDSFKFESQYRQLKTILRYMHFEQRKAS